MKSITADAETNHEPAKGHLTLTGIYAGEPLCGAGMGAKTRKDTHAAYAPLHRAEFRATVCPACLKAWVESYSEAELSVAPDWVRHVLRDARLAEIKETANV